MKCLRISQTSIETSLLIVHFIAIAESKKNITTKFTSARPFYLGAILLVWKALVWQ